MGTAAPTLVVDRASGALLEERVFGARALERIYGPGARGALLRLVMPLPVVSTLYGRMQRTSSSRARVARFVSELGIDASEAEQPLDRYPSLDAFFARRLRPGARPVDDAPDTLVAPADGRALAFADVRGPLPIKGHAVDVEELVGAPLPCARAAVLVVRLAPADYHRFHAPCAGTLSAPRTLGGLLHSVHPMALAAGAPSFANRRHASTLTHTLVGTVVLVEVGALLVGEIERTRGPGPVAKGEELGAFHFGGSTVVLIADAARLCFDEDLIANSARGLETLVRMGTRVGAHVAAPSGEVSRR
ncbi:MAG: phosphatidylserine decarboxylase [Deltaproteobacteria bacterium]|nr:phosphatidylserine decarboxylase [Deltaproteobacteria bacterium]